VTDHQAEPTGSMTLLLKDWTSNEDEISRRVQAEYFPRLRRLSQKLLQGLTAANTEADDVVQSAVMSFCLYMRREQAGSDKDRDDVWRLLAHIAACKAARRRQRQTRGLRDGRLLSMTDASAGNSEFRLEDYLEELTGDDIDLVVRDAIEHLDESLQPIALMVMHGQSQQEISEILGVSRRTVVRKFDLVKRLLSTLLDGETS
jgi:DNA-directed RNA polymerase specialized sigma24 family protein